jgi:hypothetical protein
MNEPANNPENAGPPDSHVEPAPESAPKTVADELFAHGLLTYLHTDSPAKQGERIGRLMSEIEFRGMGIPPGSSSAASSSSHSFRFPIRTARGWLALAACVSIATVAVFIGIPGEQSAQAVVQQSIEAMRSTAGGDRRYEIRLQRPGDDALPSLPGAIIDTRSPNLLLLRANAPDGHEIIAGRDATGDWCVRLDGGVERAHPQQAWPRWAKVGDESLFVDSVDRLLEELTKSYDLQREGTATLEGKGSTSYRHIVGTKKRLRSPGGDHVEVWIDPASKSVERLEMRWDLPPKGEAGPARGPGGDQGGPPEGVRPDRGPESGRPRDPMDQRPLHRDGPDQVGPNGPGPDGQGPDGQGPDGPGPGGRNRPEGPGGPPGPGTPDGLDDADGPRDHPGPPPPPGPEGRRPLRDGRGLDGPHPRPDGLRRGGPDGRPDGGPDGPRPGPGGRGPGPGMFGPGPRGPGPGVRPTPPRKLVMQRVDAPTFDAAWFTPDPHITK